MRGPCRLAVVVPVVVPVLTLPFSWSRGRILSMIFPRVCIPPVYYRH